MKRKVLIIGAKGFLGSHLFEHFSSIADVTGCDVISGGWDENFYTVDPINPEYGDLFQGQEYDLCVNCAGSADVQGSFRDPELDFRTNVFALERLLNVIRIKTPACKFINISSAAVYGQPKQLPVKVGDLESPLSPYGYHKWMADKMVDGFARIYGLRACSIRIFSAYGIGQRKLFIWDTVQKMANCVKDGHVEFFGNGNESRDYIHVRDIIRQIELISTKAPFLGEIYNVANGQEVLMNDVAEIIRQELGKKCTAVFTGVKRPGDPRNWQADISPLLEWGYTQSVPLEYGIREYVRWAVERG